MSTVFTTPPLKRHASLTPLSRDHYSCLVQAQHLCKAAGLDAIARRDALAKFLDHWWTEIDSHMAHEEELLAPLASAEDRYRLLREHAVLRELVAMAPEQRRQIDPDANWMRTLGRQLYDHVRWEERELFAQLQRSSAAELDALSEQARHWELKRRRPRSIARSAAAPPSDLHRN